MIINKNISATAHSIFYLILLCFSTLTTAKNLSVSLPKELNSALKKNIFAHLGDLPQTQSERASFLYEAKDHTAQALRALGYYQAKITSTVDKKNNKLWHLHLLINLQQPTIIEDISVSLEGDALTDEAFLSLVRNIKIKHGDILNQGEYEQIKTQLTSLGLNRGYFQGHIKVGKIAIHESYEQAKIEIIYDSGIRYRFGDVSFGQFDIETQMLNKVIPFHHGDYFTTEKLFLLQSQLQQTQFFGSSIVVPDKENSDDGFLPIKVSLTKAKSHYFDLGIGYSTDTEFRYSIGWRTPLINRYGHRQETKFEYSRINPKARFIYSIPLDHPIKNLLQFQLTLNDDKYGDLSSTYLDYKLANLRIFSRWSAQFYLRYLGEKWSVNTIKHESEHVLPGITLSKTWRKGSQLDPSWGFSQFYTLEGGSTAFGSDTDVMRLYGRWRYITSLSPKHRFVMRAELGTSIIDTGKKDSLPPSLRFYAGGDQSIRGFAYQSLGTQEVDASGKSIVVGGTRLAVASLEYQYYFTENIRAILFTDGGNASDENKYEPVYSVGTGAHYISPIGPIRLDVGYTISEDDPSWRVHFTLGTEL